MAIVNITNAYSSNSTAHSSLKAWMVCIAASLFFFYEFIQMMMFNSIDTDLISTFHVTPAALGNLSAMYFYANAIFLLPAAFLLDRVSTKKLILLATLCCSASVLGFALSHSLFFSKVCRFTEGMGAAFVMLSCMRLASRWFPTHRLALVTGIIVTIAMMGGVVAQTPLILLKEATNWRVAIACDAGLGLLISAIIFVVVEDFPAHYAEERAVQKSRIKELGLWNSFKMTWGKIHNWLTAIYTASMNLPIYLLGAIWGIMFLTGAHHHLTDAQASYATSMLFLGSIVGGPIIGWLSDTLQRRRLPMILAAIFSLITTLAIIYLPNASLFEMIALFFILGFFTSAQVLSYPLVSEMNPVALNSTSVSIISSLIMLSGAIGQPLFGWLMTRYQTITPAISPATKDIIVYHFNIPMMLMPIMFVASIVLTLFLPETFCKRISKDLTS